MRQEGECTIKEASELLNIPASTLRYWEDLGLIHSHRAAESNYRTYSLQTLFEASNIVFYRKMGVPIKQLSKMGSRSLEDVIAAFDVTQERLESEIERMRRRLKRVKYQKALSQHALDLIETGVREACPTITQLNAYNPESQWQRKTLVRDMQRYALYIDAEHPEDMVEAYVEYPAGSEAEEDAKSQEDSEEGAEDSVSGEGAVPTVLWERAKEIERGVRFFEGVAFSEHESQVRVQVAPLFGAARKAGYEPLYAIAHFLVSANFDGKKDCYHVWLGCLPS